MPSAILLLRSNFLSDSINCLESLSASSELSEDDRDRLQVHGGGKNGGNDVRGSIPTGRMGIPWLYY